MTEEPAVPDADGDETATKAVAYMSFVSFRGYLDRFRDQGIPNVLDRSFFGSQSGSLTAQVRGTFRALGLIDEDYRPTDMLRRLAAAEDQERTLLLKSITESVYGDAIALGPSATGGQLALIFRSRGINGATVQKAITFYRGLTEYVGIETSPFLRGRMTNSGGPRRNGKKRTPALQVVQEVVPAPPARSVEEEKKSAYIDLLMDLAKSDGTDVSSRADLLDRLERAIGIQGASASQQPHGPVED
jgi:hypothetical protein